MLAVLDDALATYRNDARSADRRCRRLVVESEQWFFSDDTDWPFSFVNVCDALGIDVAWLRARVRRGSDAPPPRPAAAGAAGSDEAEQWLARSPSSPPS
jgi:hypothetical protein